MTEKLKLIITIIGVVLPLLSTIFTLVIKFSKSEKAKRIAKTINYLTEKVYKYVREAEKFGNYKGIEKKAFVVTKVNQDCLIDKIKFDKEIADNLIEEILKITKEVNQREQDRVAQIEKGEVLK